MTARLWRFNAYVWAFVSAGWFFIVYHAQMLEAMWIPLVSALLALFCAGKAEEKTDGNR